MYRIVHVLREQEPGTTEEAGVGLFKDLSDEELRVAYVGERTALYNWSNIGTGAYAPGTRKSAATGTGRSLRNVEIIEAIARKRGISLLQGEGR